MGSRHTEDKTVSLRIPINEDIRARFKSRCAIEKTPMADKVVQLIQEWLEEEGEAMPAP